MNLFNIFETHKHYSENYGSVDQENASESIELHPFHSNGAENVAPISVNLSWNENQSDNLASNAEQNGIEGIQIVSSHSNGLESSGPILMDSASIDNQIDCLETEIQQNITEIIETVPLHSIIISSITLLPSIPKFIHFNVIQRLTFQLLRFLNCFL